MREADSQLGGPSLPRVEVVIRQIRAAADTRREGQLARPGDVPVYRAEELEDDPGDIPGTRAGQEIGECMRVQLEMAEIKKRNTELADRFRAGDATAQQLRVAREVWKREGLPHLRLGDRLAALAAILGPILLEVIRFRDRWGQWPEVIAVEPELAATLRLWESVHKLLPAQDLVGLPWRRVPADQLTAGRFRELGLEPKAGERARELLAKHPEG